MTLSCPSPAPWLVCVWVSPLSTTYWCVREGGGECEDHNITGEEDECQMVIRVSPSHHGAWTCMITMGGDYTTVTTYLDMEVGVRARLSISHGVPGQEPQQVEGGIVHLVEGQLNHFTCTAENGFPRSRIQWVVGTSHSLTLLEPLDKVNMLE